MNDFIPKPLSHKLYLSKENVPNKLFRGLKFNDQEFIRFNLNAGLTLPPNYIIGENGEKQVIDGQEYGLYMSDRKDLADIYAGKKDKSIISGREMSDIILGANYKLTMPTVGVVYEINPENTNIRKPKLTTFAGHQASIGDEYISDTDIPPSDVKVESLYISPDFLHDEQHILPSVNAKSDIRKILDKREEHLLKADYDLSQISDKSSLRRLSFSKFSPEFSIMRKLYGDTELAFKLPNELSKDTDSEIKDYLLCKSYCEHELDFKRLSKSCSDKAVEEFKTLQKSTVRLDPSLDIGYEIQLQKNNSASVDYSF